MQPFHHMLDTGRRTRYDFFCPLDCADVKGAKVNGG